MHFSTSFTSLLALFALAGSASAHGVLVAINGSNGINAQGFGVIASTPRNGTTRNPFQQDASIIRDLEIKAKTTGVCGRTLAGGNNKVSEQLEAAIQAGLPSINDDGTVTMTLHQVNADGAGPYKCAVSTDGSSNFTSMTVTKNVPGTNSNSNAKATDFSLIAKMPANVTCTGGSSGNACIVRCRNSATAGPFGGCTAVTNAISNTTTTTTTSTSSTTATDSTSTDSTSTDSTSTDSTSTDLTSTESTTTTSTTTTDSTSTSTSTTTTSTDEVADAAATSTCPSVVTVTVTESTESTVATSTAETTTSTATTTTSEAVAEAIETSVSTSKTAVKAAETSSTCGRRMRRSSKRSPVSDDDATLVAIDDDDEVADDEVPLDVADRLLAADLEKFRFRAKRLTERLERVKRMRIAAGWD